jgi:two-component system CheB/CheR fusion protein
MTSDPDAAFFDQILEHLRQSRGFDFATYKRSSLMRRVVSRMHTVGVQTFEQYLDYLQVHQDEFLPLFNTILINVTSFFRDADVWAYLASDVLPDLLANRPASEPLRVWSAGCASGQEPYTFAILLAEQVGLETVRDRVKIYATDLDEEALTEARQAHYSERQLAEMPREYRDKYFEHAGDRFSLNRDLRRALIFGRHDLIADAPISRIDVLLCRNTLMYFNADAQARVLERFYYSVKSGGYLMLGRAEMLFNHTALFAPVDLKRRVFRTVPKNIQRNRMLVLAQTGQDAMATVPQYYRLRDAAFETDAIPQLVLDGSSRLVAVNGAARREFGVALHDLGRPLHDLDISYRPVELRAAIDRVVTEIRDVDIKGVRWSLNGAARYFNVTLTPLLEEDRSLIGTRVSFVDVTELQLLQDELDQSKRELETAYEELQSTNEELETTNEELQSTVEELETTNEELLSTNEELETMNEELQSTNEELQSTNEELQTMNDELRNRSRELSLTNAYLESVFSSLRSAVIVVDRDCRIRVWNNRAEQLWGVRRDEARDAHVLSLDIGLPLGDLAAPLRDVLAGTKDLVDVRLPAVSRRGKAIECGVTVNPLRSLDRGIDGAILVMEEIQGTS